MHQINRMSAGALVTGISLTTSMAGIFHSTAAAQTAAESEQQTLPPVTVEAPAERKRPAASKPVPEPRAAPRQPAVAKPAPPNEPATTVATKTEEPVISTLAAVSVLRRDQISQTQPGRLSDIFNGIPGVWFSERSDDPAAAINIRGLQDFGRVATLVDGAPQDFQRSGHFANGLFYVDPELLGGVDVVRGPSANIYGSGAIGGVASFRTKDLDDILLPGEIAAIQSHAMFGSNGSQWLASAFMGARGATGDIFAGGVFRDGGDYREGNGAIVPNSGSEAESGMVKLTMRPGEGQQIKLGAITYNTDYDFGGTTGAGGTIPGAGVYATNIKNQTATAQYSYASPDTPLVNFQGNFYWNQTIARQTVKSPYVVIDGCGSGCNVDFSGPAGTTSSFMLNTAGVELHNTSRFDTGSLRNAVTYGGDFNNDTVDVANGSDPGAPLTPNGHRETFGSFVEWKTNYSTWFEMINAVRYDSFALMGQGVSNSGDRFSPKTTIGITPITGLTPYFTYAEGYRAPSVTEAFIAGFHPGSFFYFQPNPDLKPEVGKTKEIGLNIKYDNVFAQADKFRAKVNVFRNDVTDYIDLAQGFLDLTGTLQPPSLCVPTPYGYTDCFQYQNVGQARIQGLEFEANYDAGAWFAGVSGQHIRGENMTTGAPLATVPPDQISFLLGTRWLDRKMTAAMRWTAVAAKPLSQIPTVISDSGAAVPLFDPSPGYNLVSLYTSYQPTPEVALGFSVENLLNQDYRKYMCCSSESGYVVPSPGITFKASLTIREGIKGNN
jgi:hemoglobin/transferrin/lactoferrin receptor protein